MSVYIFNAFRLQYQEKHVLFLNEKRVGSGLSREIGLCFHGGGKIVTIFFFSFLAGEAANKYRARQRNAGDHDVMAHALHQQTLPLQT